MKEKLLICLPSLEVGGSTTVVEGMLKHLDYERFDVAVAVFFDRIADRYRWIERDGRIKVAYLHKTKTIDPAFQRRLNRFLKEWKPDVISSHLTTTYYIRGYVRKTHTPTFHTVHAEPSKDLPSLYRFFLNGMIRRGDIRLVACSNSIREAARTLYKVDVRCIDNGVDVSIPGTKTEKKYSFLCVARFCELKNIDILIRAFAHVHATNNDSSLAVCGTGPLVDSYRELADSLGCLDAVRFFDPRQNVDELYEQSRVYCLLSDREGGPITVLEAIAHGLPILGSDIPGIRNYVRQGENGLLVPVKDVDATAEAMVALLNEYDRWRGCAERLRGRYTAEAMSRNYQELFQS